jgi:methylase of polypeptide subunit release factors
MISITSNVNINFDYIPIDEFWNTSTEKELKMHRIHAYPAKFPAFITSKSLDFARQSGVSVNHIADIFCGCGTVAFEAKRSNIDFWGCDINPVATLIARTKSRKYQAWRIQKYFKKILNEYQSAKLKDEEEYYSKDNERLRYWYDKEHFNSLFHLKRSIENNTPENSDYRLFFLCAFSNILKATSRWLTKSIKPQIDPNKIPADVLQSFIVQYNFMISANNETNLTGKSENQIVNCNFLEADTKHPIVDMIITSPPYVTSYEYADIHQLSSLWLGYSDDYKKLRNGSVGSLYQIYNFEEKLNQLNNIGYKIVYKLLDKYKSKARSVAKYFLDMQMVAQKSYSMLSKRGLSLFIIGNTEYKDVRIDNAQHLTEALLNSGYYKVLVTKRKISKKILTPYRDNAGRFTTDSTGRKVYNEEFILIGRR